MTPLTTPGQEGERAWARARELANAPRTLDITRIRTAQALQRRGLTFTEIAEHMRVSRESVVDALYWSLR